jgi:hypothetical protein
MRMLNQAIEDAAAFSSFRDALTARRAPSAFRQTTDEESGAGLERQPGESRPDYRARVRASQKAAKKLARSQP